MSINRKLAKLVLDQERKAQRELDAAATRKAYGEALRQTDERLAASQAAADKANRRAGN